MSRFTNLFKNFVSPEDEIPTPSFIKPNRPTAPTASDSSALPVPKILISPPPSSAINPETSATPTQNSATAPVFISPTGTATGAETKIVTVPVYQSDTEWDVVQRTIGAFAERVRLSSESKQAFVKKWVGIFEKTNQKTLYRREGEDISSGHLGNKLDRSAANESIRLLGTYQATIDPIKEAGMNYELQALRQMELSFASVNSAEIAREVKNDLRCIILGSMPEQTAAAQKLLLKTQSGQPEAEKIYVATKSLANSNEMRLNATLKSTVLKMDANKYQQLGVQTKTDTADEIPFRLKTPAAPPPKTEKTAAPAKGSKEKTGNKISDSDWVNQQALDLLGGITVKKTY